ncbi:hypothetical protein HPP92_011760 [Vanilla planifolia]|uniref:ADP-ribosylation factor GTPase-activating protein AGD11 n=1 Tax=Vanilla planifolia TaxID=51239 RepID=A0A835R491_VANPL|nr:hypothetical protein HPP92_012103 [Vanilla planifolia]KAG0483676.1 hypothetical protein HPP92_011760 [Vanilla planifolia]
MINHQENQNSRNLAGSSNASKSLEKLSSQPDNRICADCCLRDPKWVSLSHGVFICIQCAGVHRSLGVHISKVLSVKLDEWTDDQVDWLIGRGGNAAVNNSYESFLPEGIEKPKPNSSIEERSDFIRRKYELKQFSNEHSMITPAMQSNPISPARNGSHNVKHLEKQYTGIRHGLSHAFRNSWRRKDSEQKAIKKMVGMVEFVGVIKVNIIRGIDLAVRDVRSSDPYVVLTLGDQTTKTRVVKSSLNPVWNETLMLSIPDPVPPLILNVFDKDIFTSDDKMGEAEIDIQPLVAAAKAYESSPILETMQLGRWLASDDNTLVKDSVISLVNGTVKQEITLKLQNVESGQLEIKLECIPFSQ